MTHVIFTRETVLARVAAGPVRYSEIAGTRAHRVRVLLRPVVDALLADGLVRIAQLDRTPHYVLADWEMSDEDKLRIIEGRCRKLMDGCMAWTGYIDPRRGPMVRFETDGAPMSARRMVRTIRRGPLGYQETVRAACGNDACVAYAHMRLGRREDKLVGQSISPITRQRIARTQQATSKLDLCKVRSIRQRAAAGETQPALAKAFGVSKGTISEIVRHLTWREDTGMFTSLLGQGRKRA